MQLGVYVNWWEVDVYMINMPNTLKVSSISCLLDFLISNISVSITLFYLYHSLLSLSLSSVSITLFYLYHSLLSLSLSSTSSISITLFYLYHSLTSSISIAPFYLYHSLLSLSLHFIFFRDFLFFFHSSFDLTRLNFEKQPLNLISNM